MAKQTINIGTSADDGTGDPLRTAFDKANDNFDELYTAKTAAETHAANTSNPHSVTKSQVGLGNADNTSDANKPISSATQTALDAKQNSLGYTAENTANKDTDGTLAANSDTKYPSQKAVKTYADGLVVPAASQSEVNTGTATGKYINPATLQDRDDDAVALVDGATIDLTAPKHTLSTSNDRTFTISHTGDCIIIDVTLSATSVTFTFPSGTLCTFAGTASGDNTMPVTATSGDHIMIGIIKVGSNYRAVGVNYGQ